MAIVLSRGEKRTFYSFTILYLGSSFLFVLIIGWLFYLSSSRQYYELTISKMQTEEGVISHKIIQAHMQNKSLDFRSLLSVKNSKYGLYDSAKYPVYTQIHDRVDFSKKDYRVDNAVFYIGHGTFGHLGVSYVVIKKTGLRYKKLQLFKSISLYAIGAYLIIAFIGFYLAKLFIYPIQSQREKLNTFIKNATHELNTPISALLLCVSSNNFHNEKNRNLIKISAKKISNLYKDLTYIAFDERQIKVLNKENIADILKKELDFHMDIADKKQIKLTCDLENTFFSIDKEDFARLVNNLISNAIKYTKRKGSVIVSLKNNTLSIKDTGIGVSAEKLDKIFQRYYRATDDIGGFGIGLDIVQSICKTYNIKIETRSKVGEGSTFILKFATA